MSWLSIAIFAYFINAGVYVADKFLLSKKIHSSVVYAFYVGIWSIFNFAILIFNFWVPAPRELLIDILGGILFLFALVAWYKALHQSEATRVVPIVGALTPIFSLMLSYSFLGDTLSQQHMLAFLVLIFGGILISVKQTRFYMFRETFDHIREKYGEVFGLIHAEYRPTRRLLFNSIASALCFAAYYVMIKYIYMTQPFIGGFVWSRLGTFIGVLAMLFVPDWRRLIKEYRGEARSPKGMAFFMAIRLLAAGAFIMLNWAISLGNVAMVNALQGVQFLFLILIILLMSKVAPDLMEEELGRGVIIQKFIGVGLVSLGLYMLVI